MASNYPTVLTIWPVSKPARTVHCHDGEKTLVSLSLPGSVLPSICDNSTADHPGQFSAPSMNLRGSHDGSPSSTKTVADRFYWDGLTKTENLPLVLIGIRTVQ